jgi:LPS sulfotransferase NodH
MENKDLLWNELIGMKNLHVIHLKRKNILRTIVSRKIAGETNVWGNLNKNYSNKKEKISFEVNDLQNKLEETEQWMKKGDRIFKDHNIISVYYEDIINNPKDTFKKITNFLGVKYVKPKTNYKKQNPEKLEVLISNYKELKSAFKGTKWEVFFNNN